MEEIKHTEIVIRVYDVVKKSDEPFGEVLLRKVEVTDNEGPGLVKYFPPRERNEVLDIVEYLESVVLKRNARYAAEIADHRKNVFRQRVSFRLELLKLRFQKLYLRIQLGFFKLL